jgi:ATP adenylyltransferase
MKGCIFCDALKSNADNKAYILLRGTDNFIILNKYPYTPGHLMIAPYKHLAFFEQAKKDSSYEMIEFLKLSMKIIREQYKPQGFNTGMNLGKCAGAGVADHYHLHVIPRWTGDSNFMPIIGNTKLTIEDIEETYRKLAPLFKKEQEIWLKE